jgi:hypothetical protein
MNPLSDWTPGKLGGGIHLGGVGWLTCAHPRLALAGPEDLSVAVWVKRDQPQGGYHAIVNRQIARSALDHFFVGLRGDLILVTGHLWSGKLYAPAPPVGQWFHLAMVQGNGQLRLFVDGVPVARQPSRALRSAPGDSPITIGGASNGADPDGVRQRFIGAVDELAIYRRALSDAEVAALADGARPAPAR